MSESARCCLEGNTPTDALAKLRDEKKMEKPIFVGFYLREAQLSIKALVPVCMKQLTRE